MPSFPSRRRPSRKSRPSWSGCAAVRGAPALRIQTQWTGATRRPRSTIGNCSAFAARPPMPSSTWRSARTCALRRLLLLTPSQTTKHVVAEVLVDGRWVIVDPAFRVAFRDSNGRLLTRQDLRVPAVLAQARQNIPKYSAEYTYENFAHVRLKRIPL